MNEQNEVLMLKVLTNEAFNYVEDVEEMEHNYPNERLMELYKGVKESWYNAAIAMSVQNFKDDVVKEFGLDFYQDVFLEDDSSLESLREEEQELITKMKEYDDKKYGSIA